MSFWNKIVSWFKDTSERNKMIAEFNSQARSAFVSCAVPVLLEAETSKGDASFRHEMSSMTFRSGFCIKAISGRHLTKEEMLFIGSTILANPILVRRMFVLGWDTFIVEDLAGQKRVKWPLKDFTFTNQGLLPGTMKLIN